MVKFHGACTGFVAAAGGGEMAGDSFKMAVDPDKMVPESDKMPDDLPNVARGSFKMVAGSVGMV